MDVLLFSYITKSVSSGKKPDMPDMKDKDYVNQVWKPIVNVEELQDNPGTPGTNVPQGKAGQAAGIAGSRQKKIAEARALVAYLAVEETGHSAAEVARFVGISRMGVQKAVIRGREFGRHEVSLEQ